MHIFWNFIFLIISGNIYEKRVIIPDDELFQQRYTIKILPVIGAFLKKIFVLGAVVEYITSKSCPSTFIQSPRFSLPVTNISLMYRISLISF